MTLGAMQARLRSRGARRVGAVLSFTLILPAATATSAHAAPDNDAYEAAVAVSDGDFVSGSVVDATLEPEEPEPCGDIDASVWYRIEVPTDGDRIVSLRVSDSGSSASFEPVIGVYTGDSFSTLERQACSVVDEVLSLRGNNAGTTYYVQVGAQTSSRLAFYLSVHVQPVAENDDQAAAERVTSLPAHLGAALDRATLEDAEPRPACGAIVASVWYRISSPQQTEIAEPVDDRFDPPSGLVFAVYRETDSGLVRLACRRYGLSMPRVGSSYLVQVGTTEAMRYGEDVVVRNDEPCRDCLPPCEDDAFNLRKELRGADKHPARQKWFLSTRNMPDNISKHQAERAVKRALATMSRTRNDCGMGDTTSIRARYGGLTRKLPSSCTADPYTGWWRADKVHVIGFLRNTASNSAGGQCDSQDFWTGRRDFDIELIRSPAYVGKKWTTSPEAANCTRGIDLESVVLHELLHAYGLDHVGGIHSNQVMGVDTDNETCNSAWRTLGRGDVLGLRKLY